MLQQLEASPLLQASYQNVERQAQLFWGQWKKAPKESIDRQIVREQHRWKMYARFLGAINGVADGRKTVLYYPGAGLDFNSLLATGLEEGIFIDPQYFRRKTAGLPSDDLRALIRSYVVRNIRFSFPRRGLMRVQFTVARRNFQLWILQGKNGEKISQIKQCIGAKPVVYLAKGTLQKAILLPPSSIARLNPQAYAVDFIPITELGFTLQSYRHPLFKKQLGERQLIIYKTYKFGLVT